MELRSVSILIYFGSVNSAGSFIRVAVMKLDSVRLVVLPVNLHKDTSVGIMIKVFMRIDGPAY